MRKPLSALQHVTRRGRPLWMERFLETGELPEDCSEDAHQFCNWQLLAGFHRTGGRDWPDPETVRQPERIPRAYGRCQ